MIKEIWDGIRESGIGGAATMHMHTHAHTRAHTHTREDKYVRAHTPTPQLPGALMAGQNGRLQRPRAGLHLPRAETGPGWKQLHPLAPAATQGHHT